MTSISQTKSLFFQMTKRKKKKQKNTQKTADKFNQEKRGNKTTGNEKQAGLRIL